MIMWTEHQQLSCLLYLYNAELFFFLLFYFFIFFIFYWHVCNSLYGPSLFELFHGTDCDRLGCKHYMNQHVVNIYFSLFFLFFFSFFFLIPGIYIYIDQICQHRLNQHYLIPTQFELMLILIHGLHWCQWELEYLASVLTSLADTRTVA